MYDAICILNSTAFWFQFKTVLYRSYEDKRSFRLNRHAEPWSVDAVVDKPAKTEHACGTPNFLISSGS